MTDQPPVLNHAALINLVRTAMCAGVACFTERVAAGEIDMKAPLAEAFGDFPAEFLRYRPSLVEALTEANP